MGKGRGRSGSWLAHRWIRVVLAFAILLVVAVVVLQWPFLKRRFWTYPRMDQALQALEANRKPLARSDGRLDLRGVFHAHSHLSHDSMGVPEEIITGAQRARIDFIFMTDHFRSPEDKRVILEGMAGDHSGILFVPGVETSQGMIAWFLEKTALDGRRPLADQISAVRAGGGVPFVCHPDEPRPWDQLPPFEGMEIYNLHADAKKTGLTIFYRLSEFFWSLDRYPMQVYHALFHDPAPYLAIWDRMTQTRRIVGVAGNDAHQNNGMRLIVSKKGELILTDTGPKEGPLIAFRNFLARSWVKGKQPGTTLWRWDVDLYERSFHFVNTHLLVRARTVPALREALDGGHSYVAFDSLVNATGFDFSYRNKDVHAVMGDQAEPGGQLSVYVPAQAVIRILRDGKEVARQPGPTLSYAANQPGVYRAEAHLEVDGRSIPWIYSNPIYLGRK